MKVKPFTKLWLGIAMTFSLQITDTLATQLKQLPTKPPKAAKIDHQYTYHNITLNDPWSWLRDSDYPKTDDKPVLDYLTAENQYFDGFKKQHQPLIDSLFEEFKGREDDTEKSVPWIANGYEYRWEYKPGENYRTYYRRALNSEQEQLLIDQPELAKGNKYFVMGDWDVSPDNRYLAYSVDTSGDERYQIIIEDLVSGKILPNKIDNNNGSLGFSNDSRNIVYGLLEKDKWRTHSIISQCVDCSKPEPRVLISELDTAFWLGFHFTLDKEFLVLTSSKSDATEAHVLAGDLSGEKKLLASREKKFTFSVRHAHGQFYILANDQHINFAVSTVNDKNPEYANWKTLIAGSEANYLERLATFKDFMVVNKRVNGLEQLEIIDYQGKKQSIEFPENLYTAHLSNNPEFNQTHIRINYESMVTPSTVFDYQVAEKKLIERQVQSIPSGYDKSLYETKRLMVQSRDGISIPVSLMYKKGIKLDASHPLHLYAYGAYGYGMRTGFSTNRLSLVDRGVIYAIAHVRGGDEMGYQWYLDGKLNKRKNTFNDFVDVANQLIERKYTSSGNISISGRSAGGELMGAATILAPQLWSGVVLGVPFVDVLNTMLDASLPLTPPEWFEWGNPITSKQSFEYIQSYSPYDNIEKTEYPPMMVTGGLNDPRVTYWEPAKWTAKMRDYKTDDNLLVMRINMGAGHFANSGRYGRLKDYAEEFAFILLSHGIKQ